MTRERVSVRAAPAAQQLRLLLGLWWRHMQRRSVRVGEAPKRSGVPAFLLLNLVSSAYIALIVWQNVVRDLRYDDQRRVTATFLVHMLGAVIVALAAGIMAGAVKLRVRGMRDDTFLDALPLRTAARLGLQLADTYMFLPLALVVPCAATFVYGSFGLASLIAGGLGLCAFVASYVVGQALVACARAFGPPASARIASYVGLCANVAGMLALVLPHATWVARRGGAAAERLARAWIEPRASIVLAYGAVFAAGALAYRVVRAAERAGFDQLDIQRRAPKPEAGHRDRNALERAMMLRQGGRALLLLFGGGTLAGVAFVVLEALHPSRRGGPLMLLGSATFAIYLGTMPAVAFAGRAARNDLSARSFLATLPLSPHQVLDGKARALRALLIPIFALLALIVGALAWQENFSYAYRVALAGLALYLVVAGAVCVSFLSTGIGVIGIGGGQASSGFSTQILILPLFATVLAPSDWAATTAFIAVAAIRREALRAAKRSVRWLDDPADDVERETTVWRALLAATAFFAMQAISYRVLTIFALAPGYLLAASFGSGAALLALLTWRNANRMQRPRFLPRKAWYWPLGAIAGAASGWLAIQLGKLWPAASESIAQAPSSGEMIAMFCTLTLTAPLIEEYFFRGWLQKAIEADLPAGRKHWALVLGAAAFALAHFGSIGVPQFVLGLLAAGLFAAGGGLWPGILAHAVHNGVVLLAGR